MKSKIIFVAAVLAGGVWGEAVLSLAPLCAAEGAVAFYPHRDDPRQHPDDARRFVKPPDQKVLKHRLHFTSTRDASGPSFRQTLDRFVDQDRLGDFIWQYYSIFDKPNFTEILREFKRRDLYLFDIWGFVPGSGKGPIVYQKTPSPAQVREMVEILGDHYLGMDTGEQDGRYVGSYANATSPLGGSRFDRYCDFQRFFERLHYLQGNRMAALVSLNFGHYLLKECCYTMIGAETAQALPNSQVYYAFIRGAGKQYGVPWFGNVSIYNRWGWKQCFPDGKTVGPEVHKAGSTKGTSLALMKKLIYAQMCYNTSALGFEAGYYWTNNGKSELSPIGRIQRGAVDWYEKNGDPGTMHVPVALMFDFFAGWSFPRHLYSRETFRTWGALPYTAGDHLGDGILSMIYPGYEDSGYYRDERGFNAPTPYGDIADCVFSDAAAWQLARYPVLVLAGEITPTAEIRDTLAAYAARGGTLVMTKGNARGLFPKGLPKGDVRVLPGTAWGVTETAQCAFPIENNPMQPLARPYPLCAETRAALDGIFRAQRLFAPAYSDDPDGLSLVTCRRAKGDYTLCLLNNTWEEKPFAIRSFAGKILSLEELPTPVDEKAYVGYGYDGATNLTCGTDSPARIAGGSVRLFRVKTDEGATVRELPAVTPQANKANYVLNLRNPASIKEEILRRPTFFRHFGGVMVDATYVAARTKEQLERESNYFKLQGLKILVDASPLMNLFPDWRFCDNDPVEKARTDRAFGDLLAKMPVVGAKDLVVTIHRSPETNMAPGPAMRHQHTNLVTWAQAAAKKGIRFHLRQSPRRATPTTNHLFAQVGEIVKAGGTNTCAQVTPALSVATMLLSYNRPNFEKVVRDARNVKMYFVAAPKEDANRQLTSIHEPVAGVKDEVLEKVIPLLTARPDAYLVFDAVYPTWDHEYADVRRFE